MPQTKATKHYYTFVGGLHTEVTPLTYPDNSLTAGTNFKLGIDGSIRRRKGLEPELNAETNVIHGTYTNGTDAVTSHFWRNVGGIDQHFHIVQMGTVLYFYEDDEDTFVLRNDNVDITEFVVSGATPTNAELASKPVDLSWGRGQALVTQQYCEPFFLSYDPDTDLVTAQRIVIRTRDFVGIEDGQAAVTQPETLEDIHKYNLLNAGWLSTDYDAYEVAHSVYPGRNQRWYRGYIRAETTGTTQDPRGYQSFDAQRMFQETVGVSSARRGKFLQDPFDNTVNGGAGVQPLNPNWAENRGNGFSSQVWQTPVAHGFQVGDIVSIAGNAWVATYSGYGYGWSVQGTWDGAHQITGVPDAFSFNIVVPISTPDLFVAYTDQYLSAGEAQVGITNPNGSATDLRPTTNAYFAGRAWYAGTPALTLGQRVLFSQIIQRDAQYGRCYQAADPTSEEQPDLIESDGGELFIPEAGRVIKLIAFGPSMLVLCENGVWEIDGGGNRYFDAIDYSVRRVSQIGCISRESVVEADQQIVFASEQGAYRIFVDPEARVLVTEPITEEKVNRLWTNIPMNQMRGIKTVYDPVEKRIIWLYDDDPAPDEPTWNYTQALLYDNRLDAFYKYTFPVGTDFTTETHLKTFARPANYVKDGQTILKFLSWNENDEIVWNELTAADWTDFGELDAAGSLETGYENMGDASRDKQVTHMTTFMERVPDSSLKFRGRWDFAESSITGKFTPVIECYKPPRAYLGDAPDTQDDDGYPVVFVKHTVPGQGLVLQANFYTVPGAEAILYGWSVDFGGIQ